MSNAVSPFSVRGVIEGYYGKPWSHAQRLELVEFLASRGMNTFVYAPKDDPLVRAEWRVPYGGDQLAKLSELIDSCVSAGVDFVYCLSPGLSMQYSSAEDAAALRDKFDSVGRLGVNGFGLLLDDIPTRLQHPADIEAFPELVDAHIAAIGDLFAGLAAGQRLIVCPTQYWGYGDEDYISKLGAGIDPRIDVFWTGRAICSATIDIADAATVARTIARPVTYWDNYPVNDVAMGGELHIGPYRGRDKHLYRFAHGIIANGMELFESSKIAFATIADYLASPEDYEPEASWQEALRDIAGAQDFDAFALFADNVRTSALAADDAPLLTAALESFAFGIQYGDAQPAARDLGAFADRMCAAAEHLLRGQVANEALAAEARPWIEVFEVGAQSVKVIAELATADRLGQDGPQVLSPWLARLRASRLRVFGDVLDMTLSDLTTAAAASDRIPATSPSRPPTQ